MTGKWHGAEPTREEVVEEISRELAYRRRCYPKWIEEGKYGLTQAKANQHLDRLQAAYDFITENWPASQKTLL